MDPMNQKSQLIDLPVELLFLIFRQAHSDCLRPQSRIYSILRLVCRALERLATQLLFESFTVNISPSTSSGSLGALHTIFENHGHHVRTLTIRNTISPRLNVEKQPISQNAQHIIARGFLFCTHIRSLICLGSHGMFSSRGWISLRVPATLTSLTFMPNKGSTDLSYCLLAIRDSLRSLEIISWRPQHDNPSPFHLPSSLPHLTDLTLTGCYPPSPHIKKLFSRIITSSPQDMTPAVPLRSLTVRRLIPQTTPSIVRSPGLLADIVSILATRQFGSYLRTLYIYPPKVNDMDATIPTALLRLCPNLVEFTYHCEHVDENVLSSLPSTLAVLELSVWPYATAPKDVASRTNILSPNFLAHWLCDGPRRKRSASGLRRVKVATSPMDLFTMLDILEGGTYWGVSHPSIDIRLEGDSCRWEWGGRLDDRGYFDAALAQVFPGGTCMV